MQPIKTTILSLTLAAGVGAAAYAQDAAAPAPNFSLPQAFNGYSQPEIKDCKTVDATHRTCTVPAMTAGYYVITALGRATAGGSNSAEAIGITVNGGVCTQAQTSKPFTGTLPIAARCVVQLLTDRPLPISAVMVTKEATVDAKGPELGVQRAPWPGFVQTTPVRIQAAPPKAAAAPKKSAQ
ncbi:MAG TPA: hypothetical protein VJP88_11565 [Caulobacteraceae bacterium]|nr:hypothetical protein [Caulobacteraceae bacterium]